MADYQVTVGTGKTHSTLILAFAGVADGSGSYDNCRFITDEGTYAPPTIDDCAWTTSSAHKIIIEPASGDHHLFARNAGVIIESANNWSTFLWTKDYIEFHGIAFTVTASGGIIGAAVSFGQYSVFDKCFAYDCIPGDKSEYGCGGLLCCDAGNSQYNKFIDSVVVNVGGPGIGGQYNTVATDMVISNCTVLNAYIGFSLSSYRSTYIKNCYAGLCTDNYYQGEGGTAYLTTCASDNGDMSTTTISIANCGFTSSTAGSEDIHISSSSYLRDAGTDLSSDTNYAFSVDGEGISWGTWGIGAIEYVATSSTSIPVMVSNYRQQGVM